MADPFHDIIERDLAIKCSKDAADVLRRAFQLCSTQRGAVVVGVAGVAGAAAALTGAFYATYEGKIGDAEIDAFWRDLIRPIVVETFELASHPFTAMQADMARKPLHD